MHHRSRHARGFTLLEVLVSVAILGLGLTAILSAQAGSFASAAHARNISIATGLLRCKMAEVEEHLYKDGFQETDEAGSGPCCEGDDTPLIRCTWRVDRPQFPEAHFGELDLNAGLNLGGTSSGGPSAGGSPLGALGLLTGAGAGASPLAGASGIGDVAKTLADANSQAQSLASPATPSASSSGGSSMDGASAGMGGIASMAMSFVYPSLKLLFEASTRRIVATAFIREGTKERAIEVTEWFTIPQKGLTVDEDVADDSDTGTSSSGRSSSGSSGRSSSGSSGRGTK
jgi:general secretion pathway protein I